MLHAFQLLDLPDALVGEAVYVDWMHPGLLGGLAHQAVEGDGEVLPVPQGVRQPGRDAQVHQLLHAFHGLGLIAVADGGEDGVFGPVALFDYCMFRKGFSGTREMPP